MAEGWIVGVAAENCTVFERVRPDTRCDSVCGRGSAAAISGDGDWGGGDGGDGDWIGDDSDGDWNGGGDGDWSGDGDGDLIGGGDT